MVRVESFIIINALPSLLMKLYLDYNNWNNLFPLTIRGVKFIKKEDGVLTVEVDHKKEGFVTNIVTILSESEIKLKEFKPKYDATFINRFEAAGNSTKYSITADISPKGIYRILSPFIKGLAKNRIRKFVLEPMKAFAENEDKIFRNYA